MGKVVVAGLLSYAVGVVVVAFAAPLYAKAGLVSRVRRDRWGQRSVPLCGGVGLLCGFACGLLFAHTVKAVAVVVVAAALFLLGTIDDAKGGLKPSQKLGVSLLFVAPLIPTGIYVNICFPYLGVVLSLLWFAGMAHAMNLLDNMDGVASGVGAVSALGLSIAALGWGEVEVGVMSAALCGAVLAVLVFNFPPARVFLGDAGSLPLGAALAALSVWATWREASGVLVSVLFPLLVLGVPLLDTLFVTTTRPLRGSRPFCGGRDHIAHRLAALGLSPRLVLLLFVGASAVATAGAVLARNNILWLLFCFLVVVAAGGVLAALLARYGQGGVRLRHIIKQKTAFLVAVFDVPLFGAAFLLAYLVRFGMTIPAVYHKTVAAALPVVVSAKIAAFLLGGAYEEALSLRRFGRCCALGTLVAIAVLTLAMRFADLSRLAFAADFGFCFLFCGAVRLLLRRFAYDD